MPLVRRRQSRRSFVARRLTDDEAIPEERAEEVHQEGGCFEEEVEEGGDPGTHGAQQNKNTRATWDEIRRFPRTASRWTAAQLGTMLVPAPHCRPFGTDLCLDDAPAASATGWPPRPSSRWHKNKEKRIQYRSSTIDFASSAASYCLARSACVCSCVCVVPASGSLSMVSCASLVRSLDVAHPLAS